MQGRIEQNRKLETRCENLLVKMPEYVREYYISLSASREMSTCYTYLCAILFFLEDYDAKDTTTIDPRSITDVEVAKFLNGLKTRVNDSGKETTFSYRKTIWFALNSFFGYLCKKGYVDSNPLELIERPHNRDEVKRNAITPQQINDLLNGITTNNEKKPVSKQVVALRNRAIGSLLFTTGMRISACCAINLQDLDMETRTIKVIDKRHKTFTYNISENTYKDLSSYLDRRESLLCNEPNDALFITQKGKRITTQTVRNKLSLFSMKYLGVAIHPHQFRATFCTSLYEETKDIEFVRRAVGHKSLSTTLRYIAPDTTAREKASSIMDKLIK